MSVPSSTATLPKLLVEFDPTASFTARITCDDTGYAAAYGAETADSAWVAHDDRSANHETAIATLQTDWNTGLTNYVLTITQINSGANQGKIQILVDSDCDVTIDFSHAGDGSELEDYLGFDGHGWPDAEPVIGGNECDGILYPIWPLWVYLDSVEGESVAFEATNAHVRSLAAPASEQRRVRYFCPVTSSDHADWEAFRTFRNTYIYRGVAFSYFPDVDDSATYEELIVHENHLRQQVERMSAAEVGNFWSIQCRLRVA